MLRESRQQQQKKTIIANESTQVSAQGVIFLYHLVCVFRSCNTIEDTYIYKQEGCQ